MRPTNEMIDAAIERKKAIETQGFRYGNRHVLRDIEAERRTRDTVVIWETTEDDYKTGHAAMEDAAERHFFGEIITAALAAMPAVSAIVPPHCSGYSFFLDPGVLHVNKDGSGYIAINEDDFVLEDDRDVEGGSVHWITRLDASDVTALRDFLNGVPAIDLAAENERLRAALERQSDNMAFVLNHMEVQKQWYEKFTNELSENREALERKP